MRLRIAENLLLALTLSATLAGAAWILVADPLRQLRPSSADVPESQRARRYVEQRPFDAAGWLAWLGSSGPLTTPATAKVVAPALAVAATLAPMDPQVLRARAHFLLLDGDTAASLDLLEKVALTFPDERDRAFNAMLTAATSTSFPRYVEQALRRGSPALDELLLYACNNGGTVSMMASMAEAIVKTRPLPDKVLDCVCERAIGARAVPFAHWLWINSQAKLPATIGFVQNGSFDAPVGHRPFDWRISPGGQYREGFAARIQFLDGDQKNQNHVLAVNFNGKPVRNRLARQVLALPAGTYELRYRYDATGLKAPLQYTWAVRCLNESAETLTAAPPSPAADSGRWALRSAEFAVPPACTGQELSLELLGKLQQETGGRGTILFDDVAISRR